MGGGFVGFVSRPSALIDELLDADDWDDLALAELDAREAWAEGLREN